MVKMKITKKEALAKFQAAREKKRECLAHLEKSMKEEIGSIQVKRLKKSLLYDIFSFIGITPEIFEQTTDKYQVLADKGRLSERCYDSKIT